MGWQWLSTRLILDDGIRLGSAGQYRMTASLHSRSHGAYLPARKFRSCAKACDGAGLTIWFVPRDVCSAIHSALDHTPLGPRSKFKGLSARIREKAGSYTHGELWSSCRCAAWDDGRQAGEVR